MKKLLLLKSLLLLCALVVGSSYAWATDVTTADFTMPTPQFSENFNSLSTTSATATINNSSQTAYGVFNKMYNNNTKNTYAIASNATFGSNAQSLSLGSGSPLIASITGKTFGTTGAFSIKVLKTDKSMFGIYAQDNNTANAYADGSVYFQNNTGSLTISNGSKWVDIGSYTTDIIEVLVIYNNTNSSTTYGDGIGLASKRAHIYVNGTCVMNGANPKDFTIPGANLTAFRVLPQTTSGNKATVDDVKIYNSLPTATSSISISANDVNIAYNATNGSIEYSLENGTGNVTAAVTTGNWLTLGAITSSTVPFTCSANTGVARTATVTLSFTGASDKVVTITQAANIVAAPTFNHGTGTYTTAQNVELSCDTEGATIHYTMTEDGTTPDDPTESDPTYTTTPISVTLSGTKIKAKAFKAGSTASSVASATYTIQPDKPTFTVSTVVTGKVNRGAQLTMSAAAGNDIIYTTDGTAASYSVPNGDIYDSPITINNPMTIKAIAVDGYGNESQQTIETYAIYYPGGVNIIPNYTFFGKDAAFSGTTYDEVTGTTNEGIVVTYARDNNDNNSNLYANSSAMRFYPKNTLQIDAPAGKTITNVVFTQSNAQTDNMTSTPSGYSSTTKTWTGDATSVTFTRTGSSYLQFTNIEVVLANKATIAAACTDGEGMYYGTYSSAKAFKVPSALVVSEIKVDNGKLQLSDYATGAVVPANTGVMIASDVAGSYTLEIATGGTSVLGSDNMLKPSGDAGITAANMTEADTKFYRLTMHNGSEIGFWWGAADGAAFDLAANKAYLAVPTTNSAREALWFGDDVTAIETVKTQQADGQYFNLAGQRVAQPTKGLYIVNGKKVIIK